VKRDVDYFKAALETAKGRLHSSNISCTFIHKWLKCACIFTSPMWILHSSSLSTFAHWLHRGHQTEFGETLSHIENNWASFTDASPKFGAPLLKNWGPKLPILDGFKSTKLYHMLQSQPDRPMHI